MATYRKTPQLCMEAARLHDSFGQTYPALAERYQVSEKTVWRWVQDGRRYILDEMRERGQDPASQLLRDLRRREDRVERLVRTAMALEEKQCLDEDCSHTSVKKCQALQSHSVALGYWNAAARLEEDLSKLRRQYTEQIELSGQVEVVIETELSPDILEALRARAGAG